MSNLPAIDLQVLQDVTGGVRGASSPSGIDGVLQTLDSITSSIKDISTKTSGFSSSQMMLLCVIAMQRAQPNGVVLVGGRGRCW